MKSPSQQLCVSRPVAKTYLVVLDIEDALKTVLFIAHPLKENVCVPRPSLFLLRGNPK